MPWGVLDNEPFFNFFHVVASEIEVQRFSDFPRWRMYHMIYDVIMTIKFYRRRRTYLEKIVSIKLTVAEKKNHNDRIGVLVEL